MYMYIANICRANYNTYSQKTIPDRQDKQEMSEKHIY